MDLHERPLVANSVEKLRYEAVAKFPLNLFRGEGSQSETTYMPLRAV